MSNGGGQEQIQHTEVPHVPAEQSHLGWWQNNAITLITILVPVIVALIGVWMYKLKMKAAREAREVKRK